MSRSGVEMEEGQSHELGLPILQLRSSAEALGRTINVGPKVPQAHTRHHHHLGLVELVWLACLEATDVPYALTSAPFDCSSHFPVKQ